MVEKKFIKLYRIMLKRLSIVFNFCDKLLRCEIMESRIMAHFILIFSLVLLCGFIVVVFGEVVEQIDSLNVSKGQQSSLRDYKLGCSIDSMIIGKTFKPNDTISIALRNLGNIPIRIQGLTINGKSHLDNLVRSYAFDLDGHLYLSGTIPAGGFGLIKMYMDESYVVNDDDIYNVRLRTNIGLIDESFEANSLTFHNSYIFESPTLYGVNLLFCSLVCLYYYRRFKMLD